MFSRPFSLSSYILVLTIGILYLAFYLSPVVTIPPYLRSLALPSLSYSTVASNATMTLAPVMSFAHGGGPMPLLGDPSHHAIIASLRNRAPKILKLDSDRPRAIVVCTAHWQERQPTISSSSKHSLLFDYYGFPPQTYKYKYDAPGSPEVAQEIAAAMREQGLKPALDEKRGWDHGVFVPMMLIRPQADIPIVQISVLESEDPAQHLAMGKALMKLRENNVAIVCSGSASIHNMREMMSGSMEKPDFKRKMRAWNKDFEDAATEPDAAKRDAMFQQWRKWSNSYDMHPRNAGEHFLPTIVAAGAAGDAKGKFYTDECFNADMVSFYWE